MKIAITGATSGIGAETLKGLIHQDNKIFLLARNRQKAEDLIASLPLLYTDQVEFIEMDLTDFSSIVLAADTLNKKTDTLDLLINNAGGIFPERKTTKDGFELTFASNHLGQFLLTQKLIPTLLKSKKPKVIAVSSEAHRMGKVDLNDIQAQKAGYSSFQVYANVKLFNILFTKSLVDIFGPKGLQAYALHPGVVKTNFGKEGNGMFNFFWKLASPFMISAKEGAETTLYLAKTEIDPQSNGSYFKKSKINTPSSLARSTAKREALWDVSMKLISPWMD
jgi:NAD(P)-dependent dehydrogenase (short-subunit alcohol dehydrogenase family)